MTATKASRSKAEPPAKILQPCSPESMQWDIQQIQLAIARRAYELFETRNCEHGHDWEDWFQAESELLRPVSISISEAADRFSVRANVLGFVDNELKVAVEPKRISIAGRKDFATGSAPSADFYPDQILRSIDLSSEIDPRGTVIELQSGVLKFELPKAEKREAASAATA